MANNFNWETSKSDMLKYLLAADNQQATSLIKDALSQGVSAIDLFEQCITPALREIGTRFESLDIFLPEMVCAAEIIQEINEDVISPAMETNSDMVMESAGKVLMATVQGDLHDIGKNMVGLMLRVNGFEVIDIGTNVSPEQIVVQAEQEQVDIIGLSSLLTTCLPYMKDVFDYLTGKGIREKYAVILGGAASSQEYADNVGADGIGHSAATAVIICKQLMKDRSLT